MHSFCFIAKLHVVLNARRLYCLLIHKFY